MIGQVCWNVVFKTINFSFNLGEPRLLFESSQDDPVRDRKLRKYTRVKGEWFLWVYNSYWKLVVSDISGRQRLSAVSSSSDKKKTEVCELLCGQKLVHIEINSKTGKTKLLFDLGGELVIRRPSQEAEKLWILYDSNSYCLSVHGDGSYYYAPSSSDDSLLEDGKKYIPKNIMIGPKIL